MALFPILAGLINSDKLQVKNHSYFLAQSLFFWSISLYYIIVKGKVVIYGLSQKELAKLLNTSHSVIGKYEREEMTPSIEAAVKLATILETTVGYLLGENKNAELLKDPSMLKRLQDIDGLPNEDKNGILYALDNLLKAAKLKAI